MSPSRSDNIFERLHPQRQFYTSGEVERLERQLKAEVERGALERIQVGKRALATFPEEWYREPTSGVVYRYVAPEFPAPGLWEPVDKPQDGYFFRQQRAMSRTRSNKPLLGPLCPHESPSPEEYSRLLQALDSRWARGEVERAMDWNEGHPVTLFHHRPTDETYVLTPPRTYGEHGGWRKTDLSSRNGTWPGRLWLDCPPPP
ncbi:hypothetical protein [Hyalangium rubrum]|uniref:Uncharacterized protein n=1 Tax=Hyalangium rubrum TaxID=3103134 RepID=A0ABU5GUP1_9BACT|nr:hypothetical protein [Hyalangium sp. s54d21]MDY7224895.1 hypothetical protein [Hyalangium sp. s54d21]